MPTIIVSKTRPDHWPDPEEVAGEYPTPFGTLIVTVDKNMSVSRLSGGTVEPVHMTAKKKHRRD